MLKWSSVKWRKCGTTESLQRSGRVADRTRRKVRMARHKPSLRKKGTSNPVWIIPKDAFNHPKSCGNMCCSLTRQSLNCYALILKYLFIFGAKPIQLINQGTPYLLSAVYIQSLYFLCKCCGLFGSIDRLQCLTEHWHTWCSVKSEFVLGGVSFGCGCLCAHGQLRAGPGERCSATVCRLSPGV